MEYTKIVKEYELSFRDNVVLTEHLPLVWSCSFVSINIFKYGLKLNLINSDPEIEQRTALTTLSVFSRFDYESEFRPASDESVHTFTYNDHFKENIVGLYFKMGIFNSLKEAVRFKLVVTVHIPKNLSVKPSAGSDFTDQVLVVGSGCGPKKEFHVNKKVLSADSPFFRKLFAKHNGGKIVLNDLDPKEFEVLLKFIDPTNVTVNDDNAAFLWKLANRFGIINVAKMCQGFLFNIEEDATQFLIKLANRFGPISVVKMCQEFLRNVETSETESSIESAELDKPDEI